MQEQTEENLQLLITGIGDSFSRLYYATSFVLIAGGEKIMIDCPEPLRKMVYEASQASGYPLDLHDINHVIITHLHGDHCNGLEGFGYFKKYIQRVKPVIYTIREVVDNLWEHRLKAAMGPFADETFQVKRELTLEDYFDVCILEEGKTTPLHNVQITTRRTKHYLPCFGFKIAYQGKSIGYSSDTSFDPEHIKFLSDADFILHETNYGGHTPYADLVALPKSVTAKMKLIHISDDFAIDRSRISVARQGDLYTI